MAARVGVVLAVTVTALLAGGAGAHATRPPIQARLVAFRSCQDLLGYVKAQAGRFVGPYGLGRPLGVAAGGRPSTAPAAGVAPQQGVDYSGTNVQEAGVDEPDIVKTNGVTLISVENGRPEAARSAAGRRGWS